jgi:peptidoglycan hydrolase CwlO-like protein
MLRRYIFIIFLTLVTILIPGTFAYGNNLYAGSTAPSNSGSLMDQLNDNLRKQEELRQKIANAQSKEKTLASEIDYLDNQVALTKLQIDESQTRLDQLAGGISDVTAKLEETKNNLEVTTDASNSRLRQIYEESYADSTAGFLGSGSFNDFLVHQKYTEAIRSSDLATLKKLQGLTDDYSQQKTDLENKQNQEQALNADLEKQKADLANQESSENYILAVTKNDEKQYQKILAEVQSEIEAIARMLGGGGVRIGSVRRGDVIAFQDNSGCSTGSHLHFGLYINGTAVNPKPYLDSGQLGWPEDNPTISQWFGENYTWYMQNFGMPGHNGIDMYKYDGAPIYAAADGVAYLSYDSGVCWMTGTRGKGIMITHNNGWRTMYWHIQ